MQFAWKMQFIVQAQSCDFEGGGEESGSRQTEEAVRGIQGQNL